MSGLCCMLLSGCAGQVKISDLVPNTLLYLYAKLNIHIHLQTAECLTPFLACPPGQMFSNSPESVFIFSIHVIPLHGGVVHLRE